MRMSDCSSDVCSSDLNPRAVLPRARTGQSGAQASLALLSCLLAHARATKIGNDRAGRDHLFSMISMWIAQASAAADTSSADALSADKIGRAACRDRVW